MVFPRRERRNDQSPPPSPSHPLEGFEYHPLRQAGGGDRPKGAITIYEVRWGGGNRDHGDENNGVKGDGNGQVGSMSMGLSRFLNLNAERESRTRSRSHPRPHSSRSAGPSLPLGTKYYEADAAKRRGAKRCGGERWRREAEYRERERRSALDALEGGPRRKPRREPSREADKGKQKGREEEEKRRQREEETHQRARVEGRSRKSYETPHTPSQDASTRGRNLGGYSDLSRCPDSRTQLCREGQTLVSQPPVPFENPRTPPPGRKRGRHTSKDDALDQSLFPAPVQPETVHRRVDSGYVEAGPAHARREAHGRSQHEHRRQRSGSSQVRDRPVALNPRLHVSSQPSLASTLRQNHHVTPQRAQGRHLHDSLQPGRAHPDPDAFTHSARTARPSRGRRSPELFLEPTPSPYPDVRQPPSATTLGNPSSRRLVVTDPDTLEQQQLDEEELELAGNHVQLCSSKTRPSRARSRHRTKLPGPTTSSADSTMPREWHRTCRQVHAQPNSTAPSRSSIPSELSASGPKTRNPDLFLDEEENQGRVRHASTHRQNSRSSTEAYIKLVTPPSHNLGPEMFEDGGTNPGTQTKTKTQTITSMNTAVPEPCPYQTTDPSHPNPSHLEHAPNPHQQQHAQTPTAPIDNSIPASVNALDQYMHTRLNLHSPSPNLALESLGREGPAAPRIATLYIEDGESFHEALAPYLTVDYSEMRSWVGDMPTVGVVVRRGVRTSIRSMRRM